MGMNCCGGDGKAGDKGMCSGGMCMHHGGKRIVMMLVGITLIAWLAVDMSYTWAQKKQVGVLPLERHTLTVSADDKVVAAPDIATLSVGIFTDGAKIADIQKENTRKFNDLLSKLKGLGIAEKDLKTTGYSIQPKYDWTNGRQNLLGYTVSQNVEVKIRDLSKAGDVLQVAGSSGANQVGGLNFTIDNPDMYQEQAREKAVAKAKAKAAMMAKQAGFTLGKIVNFSEGYSNPTPYPIYYAKDMMGASPMAESAPSVQPGTQDVTSNVSLTYEIE